MRDFVEAHFDVLALFALVVLLIAAHAFMMHWNRPIEMIRWVESLINQVFVALISYLAGKGVGAKNGTANK